MESKALAPYQPSGFNIFDLLPAFPWEGPPLPRFLQIFWAGLLGNFQLPQLTELPDLPSIGVGSYQNEETWDIEWEERPGSNEDEVIYLPATIRIHRQANRS